MVGNIVDLARQLRHPVGVPHIGRKKLHKGRLRMLRGAHRHVELVRHDHAVLRVAVFPPELVTDYGHVQRAGRLRCVLDREDHARGGQEHHDHNDDRHDGPGELHLRRSVHLRRLDVVVIFLRAELVVHIDPGAADNHQNAHRDADHEQAQVIFLFGWRRGRPEHVGHGRGLVLRPGACPKQQAAAKRCRRA